MAENYATVKDIQEQFLKVDFSTDTAVSEKDVKNFLKRKTAYINSRLCAKYDLPITKLGYPAAYDVLNQICVWLVTSEVEEILNLGRTVPKGEGFTVEKSRAEKLYRRALEEIDRIELGELALEGVGRKGGGNFYNSNNAAGACNEPVFKKNERQW
jgi:hypothetical protein